MVPFNGDTNLFFEKAENTTEVMYRFEIVMNGVMCLHPYTKPARKGP